MPNFTTERPFVSNEISFMPKERAMPITADAIATEAYGWVNDAIQRRRSSGVKRAVQEVARLYGMGERRVIAYWRKEIRQPPAHEYLAMREKAQEDLEAWILKSDAAVAEQRRRLEEMRR